MIKNDYIPVFEKEQRQNSPVDRRASERITVVRRNPVERSSGDRRKLRGVIKEDLNNLLDVLREEQKTLIDFISDKEQKKQQVFRFQLAAIAILAASLVVSIPLFERFIEQQSFATEIGASHSASDRILLVMLVFNVIGLVVIAMINLTSVAVTRQITSLKSNIILAVRQLNCNREAIQDAVTGKMCGAYPLKDWRHPDKIQQWEPASTIYVKHNKFPIDNSSLRNSLTKRHRSWIVRILSLLFFPLLCIYRKRCTNKECKANIDGVKPFWMPFGPKCFFIRNTSPGEWRHYEFDKYNDVAMPEESKLPKSMFFRVLLFGYRAAYMRSADMMSVMAMSIITTLVALLIPAGNYYLWYRINLIPVTEGAEESVAIMMSEILSYAHLFSFIDMAIILMFAFHFIGIIDMAMNKSVSLLLSEPNDKVNITNA